MIASKFLKTQSSTNMKDTIMNFHSIPTQAMTVNNANFDFSSNVLADSPLVENYEVWIIIIIFAILINHIVIPHQNNWSCFF